MDPLVIKLGGRLVNDNTALKEIFQAIADYQQDHKRMLVIVHGGGDLIDEFMQMLNLPVLKTNGLRITPKDHILFVVAALAGIANKLLLAEAKKYQVDSIGLCLTEGEATYIEPMNTSLGCVGKSYSGNGRLLNTLYCAGYVPIISSIGITEKGELLNINSDDAAVSIAHTLKGELLLLSDVAGVLDENNAFINTITRQKAQELIKSGTIRDGMAVKVAAACAAVELLNKSVGIAGMQQANELVALFDGKGIGTRVMS